MAIHIVEDDPGVCDSLTLVLQQMGHDAVAHPDAESFFDHAPPGADDTIIVDLGLPGISGTAVIRWLSVLGQRPRIIAITGEAQAAIERMLDGLDVSTVLRKPLTQERLAAAL